MRLQISWLGNCNPQCNHPWMFTVECNVKSWRPMDLAYCGIDWGGGVSLAAVHFDPFLVAMIRTNLHIQEVLPWCLCLGTPKLWVYKPKSTTRALGYVCQVVLSQQGNADKWLSILQSYLNVLQIVMIWVWFELFFSIPEMEFKTTFL